MGRRGGEQAGYRWHRVATVDRVRPRVAAAPVQQVAADLFSAGTALPGVDVDAACQAPGRQSARAPRESCCGSGQERGSLEQSEAAVARVRIPCVMAAGGRPAATRTPPSLQLPPAGAIAALAAAAAAAACEPRRPDCPTTGSVKNCQIRSGLGGEACCDGARKSAARPPGEVPPPVSPPARL